MKNSLELAKEYLNITKINTVGAGTFLEDCSECDKTLEGAGVYLSDANLKGLSADIVEFLQEDEPKFVSHFKRLVAQKNGPESMTNFLISNDKLNKDGAKNLTELIAFNFNSIDEILDYYDLDFIKDRIAKEIERKEVIEEVEEPVVVVEEVEVPKEEQDIEEETIVEPEQQEEKVIDELPEAEDDKLSEKILGAIKIKEEDTKVTEEIPEMEESIQEDNQPNVDTDAAKNISPEHESMYKEEYNILKNDLKETKETNAKLVKQVEELNQGITKVLDKFTEVLEDNRRLAQMQSAPKVDNNPILKPTEVVDTVDLIKENLPYIDDSMLKPLVSMYEGNEERVSELILKIAGTLFGGASNE